MNTIVAAIALITFGVVWWRLGREESEPARNLRATKAAGKRKISDEAIANLIRLECNRGDDQRG